MDDSQTAIDGSYEPWLVAMSVIVAVVTVHAARTVVAEGIETRVQLAYLMKMQCDIAQGYLFSPPVPAHEMERLLTSSDPWQHLDPEGLAKSGIT